jgi:hypothetical protein
MAITGAAEHAAGASLFESFGVEPFFDSFQPDWSFCAHKSLNTKHYTRQISLVNAMIVAGLVLNLLGNKKRQLSGRGEPMRGENYRP